MELTKYKKCPRCQNAKPMTAEFWHRCGKNKDGWQTYCKTCRSHGPRVKDLGVWKRCARCDEVKLKTAKYWHKSKQTKDGWMGFCKVCRNEHNQKYKGLNREEINRKGHEYYLANREVVLERGRIYRENNRELCNERCRKSRNAPRAKKRVRDWTREKYRNDVSYRLHSCFSAQLRDCLTTRGIVKSRHCFEIMGYSLEELKCHLESQFESWMSWDNYGQCDFGRRTWQIDHIIPKTAFQFESDEDIEFKKCWALENLRPLDSFENAIKGSKIEKEE